MLVDIFSSFDDHNSVIIGLWRRMWGCSLLVLIIFNYLFFSDLSRWGYIINFPKTVRFTQVSRSFGNEIGGFKRIISALFIFLIIINLSGLVPYVFRRTSHLAVTLRLGLPIWISLIISSFTHRPYMTFAGLLPGGAPAVLNPFLVLVETVSICVRPITLSVRLAANMRAGHIVLGLLGGYLRTGVFTYPPLVLITLVLIQVGYFIFEVGIALIQAYIFTLLGVLYTDDHAS